MSISLTKKKNHPAKKLKNWSTLQLKSFNTCLNEIFWSTVYKIQTIATNASQNFAVHHYGEVNQSSCGDIAGNTYNAKLLVEI